MCKHEEILTASRNAVVAVRVALRGMTVSPEANHSINEELSRLENFYDWSRFENEDYECVLCNEDWYTLTDKFTVQRWLLMTSWEQDLERNRLTTVWKHTLNDEVDTWGK